MSVSDSSQPVDHTLSSVMRALSGDKEAQTTVQYNNHNTPSLEGKHLVMPRNSILKNINLQRSFVDSAALRLRFHNSAVHAHYRPSDNEHAEIFDRMEIVRTDLLGAERYPGVKSNVAQKLLYIFEQFLSSETLPKDILLSLWAYQEMTGEDLPRQAQALLDQNMGAVRHRLDGCIQGLKEALSQQEHYAQQVLQLLERFDGAQAQEQHSQENNSGDEESQDTQRDEKGSSEETSINDKEVTPEVGDMHSSSETVEKDIESTADSKLHSEVDVNYDPAYEERERYRVYTTKFDQVVDAQQLISYEETKRLRGQLDEKLESLKDTTRRDMNQFIRELLASQKMAWEHHLDDGIIDSQRLARRIANRHFDLIYKRQKDQAHTNTVVSLLLDNSGSMRGRPIAVAAMSAELLTQALEFCGISVEILGFTTVEWKGGKSRKLWEEEQSPAYPGRLNDLRHIIYKSASTPWRKSRKQLGLMLKEGILKENIDGEAIIWACKRLSVRPEERKILMVISDGAPVDDSTLSANSDGYLDNHLRQVIHDVENRTDIDLLAIGIGHDVNRYYRRAVTIRNVDELSQTMFKELSQLLR